MNKYRLIQSLFIFLALFYDRNLVESKNENNSINAHLENYAKKNINRPLKFVELCIKKRKETDEFHYHEDDESKTGVYIAKRGFLFNSVRLNRPWYMCIFKHCKIWEAEDDRTLANMVVVNGINKTEIIVYVYLNNGDKRFYYRLGFCDCFRKDKPMELRSFLDESKYPDNVKLVFSDIFNYNMNETSKYKVYSNTLYNVFKVERPNFASYDYLLKNNVRCVKITINDKLVWRRTSKHFPLFIFYFESLLLVIIKFKVYHYDIYKQTSDKWELVYSTFNELENRDKPEKGKLLIELNRTREDKKETELKEDNAKQNQVSEDIKNNLVKSGGNTKSELVTKMQNKLEKAKKDIDIDINSKKSNEFYRYSYDPFQEVDSYECKNNYKIKLVRKGTHDLWQNEEDIDAVCVDIYHDNRNRRSSSDESDDNDISIPKKLVVIVYFEGGFKSLTVKNDPENKKNKSNNTEEVHTTKRDDKIGKSKDSKFEGFDVDVEIPYVDEEVGEENLEKYNFYDVSQKI
ncbi:conserved hypothetical protein [Theileria orientalis strain Shintoku]|uniref:Uncharacterized protein n=1 Tax=Theileria orientalis strain Shintoku TaxID=869250 RepID=J4CDS3_THEOR|nr:conserved hypothetical protein [Theileria orientalis strain Shintoku]BAM41642.1 conserved hypothetical protein [Theileria orientalis strain Shintoku]|eukprot:XP_009691943.1 conserved hypothetical protein [Theileria orientalis strain Shintoku]